MKKMLSYTAGTSCEASFMGTEGCWFRIATFNLGMAYCSRNGTVKYLNFSLSNRYLKTGYRLSSTDL